MSHFQAHIQTFQGRKGVKRFREKFKKKIEESWEKWNSCPPGTVKLHGYGPGCKRQSICSATMSKQDFNTTKFRCLAFLEELNLEYKRKWDNPSVHLLAQITCLKLLHLCNLSDPPIVNSQRGPKPTCLSICDVNRLHKRKVFDTNNFHPNFYTIQKCFLVLFVYFLLIINFFCG